MATFRQPYRIDIDLDDLDMSRPDLTTHDGTGWARPDATASTRIASLSFNGEPSQLRRLAEILNACALWTERNPDGHHLEPTLAQLEELGLPMYTAPTPDEVPL